MKFFIFEIINRKFPSPFLILNIHLWDKCDYSVITYKITEINPNYCNGFYLKSKTVIIILPTVIMV